MIDTQSSEIFQVEFIATEGEYSKILFPASKLNYCLNEILISELPYVGTYNVVLKDFIYFDSVLTSFQDNRQKTP